ncbi:hypothetical protein PO878_03910 [Iamia majanohamensis]|uniref:Uncharacterized protein n=1 Tax=Iamia majanohamensis TaxID=467976 RepID=A0AAF0BWB6_9ACTN|nr:hypothetical protein [Iamia majanohamensis]WCO67868.1 hypothetical protein PO878_03910 [Iamia majanohamensis]
MTIEQSALDHLAASTAAAEEAREAIEASRARVAGAQDEVAAALDEQRRLLAELADALRRQDAAFAALGDR